MKSKDSKHNYKYPRKLKKPGKLKASNVTKRISINQDTLQLVHWVITTTKSWLGNYRKIWLLNRLTWGYHRSCVEEESQYHTKIHDLFGLVLMLYCGDNWQGTNPI